MRRLAAIAVCLAAVAAAPAEGYLSSGGGAGTGSGRAAALGSADQPAVSADGTTVTVTWTQTAFLGAPWGYSGGGYTVWRYPSAGGAGVTPDGSCAATVSGSGNSLTCVDEVESPGSYKYSVTPVLNSWTGNESLRSGDAPVEPDAPVLDPVTRQDPGSGQSVGALRLSWGAVNGATGYNVFRRTSGGSFDFAAPVNGAVPLTVTDFTDPGAGLSAGTTYVYVVRALAGGLPSDSSAERSATPVARASAPASVTATRGPARITVDWSAVAGSQGYNVYRRTSTGSFASTPLNGATPVTATSYVDTAGMSSGTAYVYKLRTVTTGASGTPLESFDSATTPAVTYDAANPTGALTDPGSPKRGTITLTATSVADTVSGPPTLRFQSAPTGTSSWTDICVPTVVVGTTTYTCSFDTTTRADGTYDLRILVTDGAGNVTTATRAARRIDNTAPTVTPTDPGPYVISGENLAATATDVTVANVAFQYLDTSTSTWTNICSPDTSSPYTCGAATTFTGTWSVRAVATDAAGNQTVSAVYPNVTFDRVVPTGTTAFSAVNNGMAGRGDADDVITFTFSEPVTSTSVLAGWNGSAITVQGRFTNVTTTGLDRFSVVTTAGAVINLGTITTQRNLVTATTNYTTSTMVMSGSNVIVTLGGTATTLTAATAANMSWTPSSAARDAAGNATSTTARVETDNDVDF